jgi:hypothetical protein
MMGTSPSQDLALAEPKVARQLSSAVNTPQGPRVCRDCNVALPIAAFRRTCSTARSATWTSKAARSFIGYQTIPLPWSLHAIDDDGVLHHREFLADGGDAPRRRFAETLIEAFAAFDDPILVYSAYEQTRLKDVAGEYPDLSASLDALITRLVDPLPVVGGAVYFPEFRFSNSIKSVAPALCPGFGYDDLEGVAAGGAASAAFLQLASGYLTIPVDVDHLRSALLEYCHRDNPRYGRVAPGIDTLGASMNG